MRVTEGERICVACMRSLQAHARVTRQPARNGEEVLAEECASGGGERRLGVGAEARAQRRADLRVVLLEQNVAA
eukprot:4616869-Pleurochrysis_carterae.AAC.1